MTTAVQTPETLVEWAVVARPRHGESVSGDAGLVRVLSGGVLVAGVDGLGHGEGAAAAAARVMAVVAASEDGDVLALMERCHHALAGARGAAVSLAWLDAAASALTWLALGDVDGRLLRLRGGAGERALRLPGGLVGADEPTLAPETIGVSRGDVVVLTSDGVHRGFADDLDLRGVPQGIAERILAASWDGTDDGLAVVVRWLPGAKPAVG